MCFSYPFGYFKYVYGRDKPHKYLDVWLGFLKWVMGLFGILVNGKDKYGVLGKGGDIAFG